MPEKERREFFSEEKISKRVKCQGENEIGEVVISDLT
jgi:hypothetical protein